MDFYTCNNQIFANLESIVDDRFLGNLSGFNGDCGNVDGFFLKPSESLVLDEEKGELVKGQPKVIGKKIGLISDEKSLAALKSHSDAERRRRERINAHLDTLRGLVPSNDKAPTSGGLVGSGSPTPMSSSATSCFSHPVVTCTG